MNRVFWSVVMAGLLACNWAASAQNVKSPSATAFPRINVLSYKIDADLFPDDHDVKVDAVVEFETLEPTDRVIFGLSKGIETQKVLDERGEVLEHAHESSESLIQIKFGATLPAGTVRRLRFSYTGNFEKLTTFKRTGAEGFAYIGNEGTYLLYPAKWIPISGYLVDRARVELNLTVPLGFVVVSSGTLKKVTTKGITETFTWVSDREILPGAVIAARLFEKSVSKSGVNLVFYLEEKFIGEAEKFSTELEKVFNYYQGKFGKYPFGAALQIVQVDDSVRDLAGAAGVLFVQRKDLEARAFPVQLVARRLAYQWWLHALYPKTVGDLWLGEGFAYYSPALFFEEKVSSESFQNELVELAILALKFEGRGPIAQGSALGYAGDTYESIVAGKGAWVLHMFRTLLGDENFFKLLSQFFAQYEFKTVSIDDFQNLAAGYSKQDLRWFFTQWIQSAGVPEFTIEYISVKTKSGFKVRGAVKQDLDLFRMPVEIEIETKGKKEYQTIQVQGKSSPFEFETFTMPLRVAVDPKNRILRNADSLRLSVHLAMGKKLSDKGEFVDAIREFTEATKLDPRSSLAHYYMAETFYEQYNLQSAANSFRDALNGDLKPKWLEVWSHIYMGKIYDILGQRERAKAEYNKAINLKDDHLGAQSEADKYLNVPFTRERNPQNPS
ncbi:MAG: hypothetical protein HYR55_15325 [Acidobacteria bacterium]|nr:hypothetical protein [Acidobacteriota bacterium]MBI3657757.1 hypothetical protein [Acidobacteriota bacterium]